LHFGNENLGVEMLIKLTARYADKFIGLVHLIIIYIIIYNKV